MAAYDDLNVNRIFAVGFFSIFVLAATALAVQILYFTMLGWQQAETSAESDYRRQSLILDAQAAEISSYGINPDTGNVVVPIDLAIQQMVQENSTPDSKSSDRDET